VTTDHLRRPVYPRNVDEKPHKSPTVSVIGTIDPKTLAIVNDAAKSLARIDPNAFGIAQQVARSFQTGVGAQVATSLSESLRTFSAPAMTEALKGFQTPKLIDTNVLGETLERIHSTPSFNFAKTLDTPIVTPKIAEALRPSFAETFAALEMPKVFTAGVNEALKDLARMPRFEVGPRFATAIREAAAIAESPAVIEQAEEALVDLDELTPVQRRELQKDLANAVAAILTLVAYLLEDDRVQLASICLALAALFVSVYWRVMGKLDE
jgi:hypothetical protein